MTHPNLPSGPCWVEQQDKHTFKVYNITFEGCILHFANFFEEKPDVATFQIDMQDWRDFSPSNWVPDFLAIYLADGRACLIGLTPAGVQLRSVLL